MSCAVGSRLLYGSARVDAAVQVYYVVVTYLSESALAVPVVQVLDGVISAGRGGAAVDYYFCYLSHILFC